MEKYKWNAGEYSKYSSAQKKWAQESVERVNLKSHEHVLDVGCGDGKITVEIAGLVPEGSAVGIDNSEEMIELAKNKFPKSNHPNLSFQVLDARFINFKNEFDVILSNAALHWVNEHVRILKGMHGSLKPGGRILLQMGGKGNVPEAFSIVNKVISYPVWSAYFENFKFPYYFYSVEEYKAFLSQTEFKRTKVEIVEKDMQHKGNEGVTGWIKTTWLPYLEKVPGAKKEEFIELLFAEYAKKFPPDSNGFYHATAKRLIVTAEK